MSKRNAHGPTPIEILHSPAWRVLSSDASSELVARARRCDGRNNGLLTFRANSGAAAGLSADATQRALAELRAVDLIDARRERR